MLGKAGFLPGLANSLFISLATLAICLSLGLLAAYAISRSASSARTPSCSECW